MPVGEEGVDGDGRVQFPECSVDPDTGRLIAEQQLHLQPVDWSKANWGSVPALHNLSLLSPYSTTDIAPEIIAQSPPRRHRVDLPIEHPETSPVACLSDCSHDVALLEDTKMDFRTELGNLPVARLLPDGSQYSVGEAIRRATQLIGLSDLATKGDPRMSELVGCIAEANSKDYETIRVLAATGRGPAGAGGKEASESSSSRQHQAYSTKPHRSYPLPTNTPHSQLLKDVGFRPTQFPNRSFCDSDIVTYPQLLELRDPRDSEYVPVEERKGPIQRDVDAAVAAIKKERLVAGEEEGSSNEVAPEAEHAPPVPSRRVHHSPDPLCVADGAKSPLTGDKYLTWHQRAILDGSACETKEGYEAWRDEVTSWEGRYRAVLQRIEGGKGTGPSPSRVLNMCHDEADNDAYEPPAFDDDPAN